MFDNTTPENTDPREEKRVVTEEAVTPTPPVERTVETTETVTPVPPPPTETVTEKTTEQYES